MHNRIWKHPTEAMNNPITAVSNAMIWRRSYMGTG